jgi:hypothetical protein
VSIGSGSGVTLVIVTAAGSSAKCVIDGVYQRRHATLLTPWVIDAVDQAGRAMRHAPSLIHRVD